MSYSGLTCGGCNELIAVDSAYVALPCACTLGPSPESKIGKFLLDAQRCITKLQVENTELKDQNAELKRRVFELDK